MAAKTVLITGVSRGLGLAMANWFLEQGHRVAGCSRASEAPEGWNNESAHYTSLDLSDDSVVANWSNEVITEFGTPDLIINNAAIINRNASLWDIREDEFAQLIDINIHGTVRVLRHFLPALIERGSGVIVNFSSGWGRSASSEVAPYCASKWAIEGLTAALAQELPPGLAAVAFNPGVIDTEMLQSCFGAESDAYPTPDEWVTRAAPFLDSIQAYQNGQALTCP